MIQGIGIDAVDIMRCAQWHLMSPVRLQRIFSAEEISYCRAHPLKSAERFAVRFAAKEAFFKAWSSAFPEKYVPFLTVCKAITVELSGVQAPSLRVRWELLPPLEQPVQPLLSLTHTRTIATAAVLLQSIHIETK
jgi:phosphopantetheine--protein transferase-like protein